MNGNTVLDPLFKHLLELKSEIISGLIEVVGYVLFAEIVNEK